LMNLMSLKMAVVTKVGVALDHEIEAAID
jgi:hypothetical protein